MLPNNDDEPDAGLPYCRTCHSLVSHRYQRVFGDNYGDVHACPNCANRTDLAAGAGAGKRSQGYEL